jgi:sulfite exporter TauE/SafE
LIEILGAAALMGLVGSVHCVGMCGPFALACSGRAAHVLTWQGGKLATYAALGAVAGYTGGALPGPAWLPQLLSGGLIVWFGAAMAGLVPEPAVHLPGLTRFASRAAAKRDLASRALFGAANGLLPCGLVYAALGLAISAGAPGTGALAMVAFGLGTMPLLTTVALSAHRVLHQQPRARRVLAAVATLAGLWVVATRSGAGMPVPLSH